MSDKGSVYPPRDAVDVYFFDDDEVVAGFREFRLGDPEPGPNRSPGYRWGWATKATMYGIDDGLDDIRTAVAAQMSWQIFAGVEGRSYAH